MYFPGDFLMWKSSKLGATAEVRFFFDTGTKITFGQTFAVSSSAVLIFANRLVRNLKHI